MTRVPASSEGNWLLRRPWDVRVADVWAHSPASRVRPADVDDALAIAEVHVSSWRAAYAGLLPERFLDALSVRERQAGWQLRLSAPPRGGHVLVVEEVPGDVRGFASVGPSRDRDARARTGELQALYVHSDHWSRGLGSLLHDHALNVLRADGFETATLWVLRSNHPARRFYAKAGWTPDGTSKTDHLGEVALAEVRYSRSIADA